MWNVDEVETGLFQEAALVSLNECTYSQDGLSGGIDLETRTTVVSCLVYHVAVMIHQPMVSLEAPFDLEIFVAGYAASSRPPELATRSQRVFMQLAKRKYSLHSTGLLQLITMSRIRGITQTTDRARARTRTKVVQIYRRSAQIASSAANSS